MKTAIWTYLFCPLNASLFGQKNLRQFGGLHFVNGFLNHLFFP